MIPAIIFALTLGAGSPDAMALVDQQGNKLFMNTPAYFKIVFDTEFQWDKTFFLGGSWLSTCNTSYNDGFMPLQADYKVWAGVTLPFKDFQFTAKVEHTCDHPQSNYEGAPKSFGLYEGSDEFKVSISTGTFLGN